MTARDSLRAVTQTRYPRAVSALLLATLAVIIDLIVRSGAYRDLLLLLPAGGIMKLSAGLALAFLQGIAIFYLIILLPEFSAPWPSFFL